MNYRVLVTDNLSNEGVEILKKYPQLNVDVKNKIPPEELKNIIGEYDAIVVRSATKLTADILDKATHLKVAGRAGIGVDNIDVESATKRGIVVMNTPGGNSITTAEHTIALLFAVARKIPQATASVKAEKWEKSKFEGIELYNKTIGIIGLGNIGGIVADRCIGLKMRVIGYDPFIKPEKAKELGVELVSLEEIYRRADIISVHVPLSKDTKGLINKDTISKMKDGVIILNCARGGIVNEADLIEGLKSGKIGGAGLDVFEKEPPGKSPLFELENVVLTPHLGASTREAQVNVAIAIAEQIVDYLINGIIKNAVNFPAIPSETLSLLKPYIDLSEKLGRFLSQVADTQIEAISIDYSGEISSYNTAPLTIATLKGLLTRMLGENVNYINAPLLARERGLKLVESKSLQAEDYQSLVTVKMKTVGEEFMVAGTIFGKKDQKFVKFGSYDIEVIPEGNILMVYNNDKPGVLGAIGTYLGKSGVNIAGLQLGRDKPGGRAVAFIMIDAPVSDEVVNGLTRLENIISAKAISI
jgi:D-3-phosphoglycerate dehydrogenase